MNTMILAVAFNGIGTRYFGGYDRATGRAQWSETPKGALKIKRDDAWKTYEHATRGRKDVQAIKFLGKDVTEAVAYMG
jgi:hypothetical protein